MQDTIDSYFIQSAGEEWHSATRARFLDAVADGSLPPEVFQRWLVQDYHFAKGLTSFQAIAAARTPRPAQSILIAGLAAMDRELDWFEEKGRQYQLALDASVHKTCRRYVDFLLASAYTQPFEVLLAILFGVEASYLTAWGSLHAEGPYAEYIERWTHPDFRNYVLALREQAQLHHHPDQQHHFNQVLRHESDFWKMTWEG
jgi:thiaminase/transcriptional activator TenA